MRRSSAGIAVSSGRRGCQHTLTCLALSALVLLLALSVKGEKPFQRTLWWSSFVFSAPLAGACLINSAVVLRGVPVSMTNYRWIEEPFRTSFIVLSNGVLGGFFVYGVVVLMNRLYGLQK